MDTKTPSAAQLGNHWSPPQAELTVQEAMCHAIAAYGYLCADRK